MTEPTPPQSNMFQITVPEAVAGGHFADFASIWHTQDFFVFDFAALSAPPRAATTDEGDPVVVVPTQVVSRVRVLPAQVIEIMKALATQLDQWENERGLVPPSGA
jgi:D-alanine-D-alanine ligase-like ATP-grasp enzyme